MAKVRGKLDRIKSLGEETSDEVDASKWIEKQRRVLVNEAAEKRSKELEVLGNEFGVEALVTDTLKEDRQNGYDRKNLKGLKFGHSAELFGEANIWPGCIFDSHCHLNLVLRLPFFTLFHSSEIGK